MPTEFQRACRDRAAAIDRLAAEYVRAGIAPWEAHRRAAEEVDGAARRKALDTQPNWRVFGPEAARA